MVSGKTEPNHDHVRASYKMRRRIHAIRRYAWDAVQLIQELRQDQYGLIPDKIIEYMGSVESNAEKTVMVAEAYIEQCSEIDSFFASFQEKKMNDALCDEPRTYPCAQQWPVLAATRFKDQI